MTSAEKITLKMAPPPKFHQTNPVDPFVEYVFSCGRQSKNSFNVGIGDPMRITAVPQTDKYWTPFAAGCLIDKMCYWIINRHESIAWDNDPFAHYRCLLTHPLGMTGYTVPYCDVAVPVNTNDPNGLNNGVKEFLIDQIDPNRERQFYQRITSQLTKRRWRLYPPGVERMNPNPPLAYISTNPLCALAGGEPEPEFSLIKNYLLDSRFHNVVMTAILVGKELYDMPTVRDAVKSLTDGLFESINKILDGPDLAAYLIYTHYLDHLASPQSFMDCPPFFAGWKPTLLAQCLRFAAGGKHPKIYSESPLIKRDAWEKTRGMRKRIEGALPRGEKWRKVDDLNENFYASE